MAQSISDQLLSAFTVALRRAIFNEPDRSKQLAKMGEARMQMTSLLQVAPYSGDANREAKHRAELAAAMEAAYLDILTKELLDTASTDFYVAARCPRLHHMSLGQHSQRFH
jgi:hypothetical protein